MLKYKRKVKCRRECVGITLNPQLHYDKKGTREMKLIENAEQADRLVELIAHSKAVWIVPELRNLVAIASSPSSAHKLVLQKTGKQKKAKAAHKFAQALRDYEPLLVRSSIRYLEGPGGFRPEKLREFLSTMLQ